MSEVTIFVYFNFIIIFYFNLFVIFISKITKLYILVLQIRHNDTFIYNFFLWLQLF